MNSIVAKGMHTAAHSRKLIFALSFLLLLGTLRSYAYAEWLLFGRAEKRYEQCVALYTEKNYDEARTCITNFLEKYPNSRWVEHLRFLEAKMESDVSTAKLKLHHFVLEYPNGPYSAQANFSLGEIYELTGEYEEAQKFYSRVYFYSSPTHLQREAGLRMAKCMLLNGDITSATTHLETYMATYDTPPWHSRAKLLYADVLYAGGEYVKAQRQYKEIISRASSPDEACSHCYLRIAEIYEANKEHEAALQVYRRFITTFPEATQKAYVESKIVELAARLNIEVSRTARRHLIEAGVFNSEAKAMALTGRLRKLGYQAYLVTRNTRTDTRVSVRLGPYESRDAALAVAEHLKREAALEVILLPQGSIF
jgi:TolA-binding protein